MKIRFKMVLKRLMRDRIIEGRNGHMGRFKISLKIN